MPLGDALARCGNTDRPRAEGKIVARESYSAMKLQAMVSTIPPVYPLGAGSFNLVHL
jgi:hypothetical protein